MKIKIDECPSPRALGICHSAGHDATTAREEGLNGKPDAEVLAAASAEGRVVITMDRRFGDARQFPPGSHAGIIVLRPRSDDKDLLLDMLASLVARPDLESFIGCVVVVQPESIRVQRPEQN